MNRAHARRSDGRFLAVKRRLEATLAHSTVGQRRVVWWACWSSILAVGLTLRFLETTVYLFGAVNDDQLFVDMAHGFLRGQWSSTWGTTGAATLTKPVGYPLFLAAAHIFPWSPVWSAYVLYVIGASLIAWSWFRMRRSRPQATVLLAVLVFNPIAFTSQNERVYRDMFIMALFTVAVGVAFVLAALLHDWAAARQPLPGPARLSSWLGASATRRWAVAYVLVATLGLIVGFAAITKETWVWLLPAAVTPLAYPLVQRLWASRFHLFQVLRMALAALTFLGCLWGVIAITKHLDGERYHVALVDDMSSGSVARAWKLWASVEAGSPRKYVPITRAMRLAVYRVSPTAAKMKPYLESPLNGWKKIDCASVVHICNESGPWFVFDLLTAAVETGKVNSVRQLETFFNQIADDIARGCERGELRCSSSPVLAVGLPVLSHIPVWSVAPKTMGGLWQMVWDPLPMNDGQPSLNATLTTYDLWSSVIRGMPPLATINKGGASAGPYAALGVIDGIYRAFDLAILAAIVLGLAVRGVVLTRRTTTVVRLDPEAALLSGLFFGSSVFAMATLALLAVVWYPQFVNPLYWTDFAAIPQLCLVFGLFSLAPLPRRKANRNNTEIPLHRPVDKKKGIDWPSPHPVDAQTG